MRHATRDTTLPSTDLPRGETTWTTDPQARRTAAQAGEVAISVPTAPVESPPRWRRWFAAMSEISEKTRIILNWGGAVLVVGTVFFAGRIVESWQQGLTHGAEKNVEQDTRIAKLETAVMELKDLVKDGRRVQDAAAKDSATAAANTTGIIYDLGELKVRLAERGIAWPDRRGSSP